MVEVDKRKWRPFRRNRTKTQKASGSLSAGQKASTRGEDDTQKASVRSENPARRNVTNLFARARKKKIVTSPPRKNTAAARGPVIIPSRSFEATKDSNGGSTKREFKLSDELKQIREGLQEIRLNKVGNSMETHQDSVSSAQEDSLQGDIMDHSASPPRRARRDSESNLGGVPETNSIPPFPSHLEAESERSSQVASQAQTMKMSGSPNGRSAQANDQEASRQWNDGRLESAFSHDSQMPNEVMVGGVPACSTQEDLTVFSEKTADRDLGISTPPVLKRNRSRNNTGTDSKSEPVSSTSDNPDATNEAETPQKDRVLRRLEMETLMEQLKEEKERIKKQIAAEAQATLAAMESRELPPEEPAPIENADSNESDDEQTFSVIDWDFEGTRKPIAVTPPRKPKDGFEAVAQEEGLSEVNFSEASFAASAFGGNNQVDNYEVEGSDAPDPSLGAPSTFAPSTVASSTAAPSTTTPRTDTTTRSRTVATESFFRFAKSEMKNSDFFRSASTSQPTTPDRISNFAPDPEGSFFERPQEEFTAGVDESFEPPILKRTTSDGSLGLETGIQTIKRSDSAGSVGVIDPFAVGKSRTAPASPLFLEETIEVSRARSTEDRLQVEFSEEIVDVNMAMERERLGSKDFGADVHVYPVSRSSSLKKDYKVRLVENESLSRLGGVEVDLLPGDAKSQLSGDSKGRQRALQYVSGSEGDSHYDSDPDPFSGIEEARLAALTLALKNARSAVANKAGETDALINDPTFTKRPGRVLFQRKDFFKRLKQRREKKEDKDAGVEKPSNAKVTRKGKLAPQGNNSAVKPGSPKRPLAKATPPPPPPPPARRQSNKKDPPAVAPKESVNDSLPELTSFNMLRQAADTDIEVNVDRASPSNILGRISVVEEERATVVSDEDDASDASSWDEGSQDESSDEETIEDFGVGELMHSVAKTFTRTVTWGAGFGLPSHPAIYQRATLSDGALSDGVLSEDPLSEDDMTFEERDLGINRSFSFSAGQTLDEVSCSDEDTIRSDDVLALRSRFACM